MFTKKELIDIWKRESFRAKKNFGQNFLVDLNIKNRIIDLIAPSKHDSILEIGPGFGELTCDLADLSGHLTCIEKDDLVAAYLRTNLLAGQKNVEVINGDFLNIPVQDKFTKIAGNLPYYITTPIIEIILSLKNWREVFIMVQKEYGERVMSGAGDDGYSSLSIFVKYHARAEKLLTVKSTCFFPVPKVDSVLIKLVKLNEPAVALASEDIFFRVVRTAFQHRRKMLKSALLHGGQIDLDKDTVDAAIDHLKMDGRTRPERLDIGDFAKLANAIHMIISGGKIV